MAPSAMVHPSEYDYRALKAQMEPVMDETLCYVCEWYEEKLPLENKDGTCMDLLIKDMIDNSVWEDPFYEYIRPEEKKPAKPPDFDKPTPPKKEKVLIFTDSHGYCDGIIKHAPEGRVASKQVMTGTDYDQAAVDKLLAKKWDLLIFGSGLDYPETNAAVDMIEKSGAVSKLFYHICKSLVMKPENVKRMAVITRGCWSDEEEVHQEVGTSLCVGGCLFGHSRTARMEINQDFDIPIQYIDTEYNKDLPEWMEEDTYLIERLSAEVFRLGSFGHNDVRILHSGRYVLRHLPADDYEKANWEWEMPTKGTIAISGGNGALALIMGMWLLTQAEKQKATGFRIQFLSRSAKIGDDLNAKQWKKIQDKASKLGIEVSQDKCDISDRDGIDEYMEALNGQLVGFIHSAGVLKDQMLRNLEWEQCEQVFNPKHRAALYIHEAMLKFPQPDLKFFWMFSSIAAYGNMGQWNYSGSNSFLDSLARHRRALGLPACAMQWGGWGEVGMAASMDEQSRRRMAESIMPAFKTKDGLKGMEAGLRTGLPGFSVFQYNAQAMFQAFDDCDSSIGCHSRNFISEICPTPNTFKWERKHMMTIFRMSHGSYADFGDNLIWEKFIYPHIEVETDDEEEQDMGEVMGGYGMAGNSVMHF
eukprot:gnl/MRDRNA2_/MRDRNA2_98715_c0_seq1.p1 gnl/MRDRNA2_/MRDRNA2_98715_c0~~gnl/MRDRNA2_/MRDRNA2_98715_c0_seq1.p1  ORF type:complete len:643 (+),score=147.31 gnl/MRDRNA2_/MRDRNA2_98715_c0_seq1:83-2011(+)